MNDLQERVELAIFDKLIDFAMVEAKSLYNLEIMYRYYVDKYKQIYRCPDEHLTKIMFMAYRKTLKEYGVY